MQNLDFILAIILFKLHAGTYIACSHDIFSTSDHHSPTIAAAVAPAEDDAAAGLQVMDLPVSWVQALELTPKVRA